LSERRTLFNMAFTKGASRGMTPWAPIPIVQVDVDELTNLVIDDVLAGQRVWLEVMKDGQVVGIVEATAEAAGGLSKSELQVLTRDFADLTLPPRVVVSDELLPRASIVVPTLCRDTPRLVRAIESLLTQNYPDFEVIVVDNRPAFSGLEELELTLGPKVRTFREPIRGVSAARNRGIINAQGDFVAFTDDDVVVDSNWLRELATTFVGNPEVNGIGGLVLPKELKTQAQLWFEEFFGGFKKTYSMEIFSMELLKAVDPMFPYAPGRFGAGCNMAIRRSALLENGSFVVALGTGTPTHGGEDLELLMKQVLNGGSLAFEPRAVVRHLHRESEREFLTQVFGYGTGLTAMFTSLVLRDPRHLARIIRRIPGGIRLLTTPRNERSPSSTATYPRRAYLRHVAGLLYGPFAYVRSVARLSLRR